MQIAKLNSCIEDGNKKLLYFLFILLFIHFTIILPAKHSSNNYEVIGTSESVTNQINLIEEQVAILEKRRDTIYSQEALDNLDDKINKLQSQKIQFQKEQIELTKQKVIDRSFSLPVLNVSISESIVRTIYPGFILVALCYLLSKRKRFIDFYASLSESEKADIEVPIWATPVPLILSRERLSSWSLKNILGFAVHFALLYIAFNFIFTEMTKDFTSLRDLFHDNDNRKYEILAIDLLLISVTIIYYLDAIIHTVKIEWQTN